MSVVGMMRMRVLMSVGGVDVVGLVVVVLVQLQVIDRVKLLLHMVRGRRRKRIKGHPMGQQREESNSERELKQNEREERVERTRCK